MLLEAYGIARAGAIVSKGAADADPMQLARGLLNVAVARGARLFDAEAVAFDSAGRSVGVTLANGREIEARSVVLATGYAMPDIVQSTIQTVSSSWAIATTPQPQNIWKDAALIWENSKDYLYARTTRAGRIIIGGEDSERDRRTRGARSPDPGKITPAGATAGGAVAGREHRHRIPLGRHLRYHARWTAADRPRSRRKRHLCRLRLWRQRHHVQLHGGAADRRSDRRRNLAIAERFRVGPGWRIHQSIEIALLEPSRTLHVIHAVTNIWRLTWVSVEVHCSG